MLLQTLNLTKQYDARMILDHVNITIFPGDILSLIGPSGSGKTTLLKCIAGLEQPNSGTIILKEKDITRQKAEQRPVVMMFQQPLLFPHMSVLENIVYGLKVKGADKKSILAAGEEMLQKIELSEYGSRYPYELSGGQQQRVALARALIMKPQLLLLDEPFANLDPELRGSIRNWVRKLLKDEDVSAIFVTHDREEAMIMGNRIAVIVQGKILQEGSPLEVYKKPNSRPVAELFSDGLVLDDNRLIPVNNISLSPLNQYTHHQDFISFKGNITGKWIKAGQNMYQVDISMLGKEVIVPASADFHLYEQIILFFPRNDIYFFPMNEQDGSCVNA